MRLSDDYPFDTTVADKEKPASLMRVTGVCPPDVFAKDLPSHQVRID
jgi:hypothetical protein